MSGSQRCVMVTHYRRSTGQRRGEWYAGSWCYRIWCSHCRNRSGERRAVLEVGVNPVDIDRVSVGQEARIRFSTFGTRAPTVRNGLASSQPTA